MRVCVCVSVPAVFHGYHRNRRGGDGGTAAPCPRSPLPRALNASPGPQSINGAAAAAEPAPGWGAGGGGEAAARRPSPRSPPRP